MQKNKQKSRRKKGSGERRCDKRATHYSSQTTSLYLCVLLVFHIVDTTTSLEFRGILRRFDLWRVQGYLHSSTSGGRKKLFAYNHGPSRIPIAELQPPESLEPPKPRFSWKNYELTDFAHLRCIWRICKIKKKKSFKVACRFHFRLIAPCHQPKVPLAARLFRVVHFFFPTNMYSHALSLPRMPTISQRLETFPALPRTACRPRRRWVQEPVRFNTQHAKTEY